MSATVIVPGVVGMVMVVVGALIIRFRNQVRDEAIRSQRWILSKRRSARWARLQTPFWIGAVGATAVLFGAIAITVAAMRLFS